MKRTSLVLALSVLLATTAQISNAQTLRPYPRKHVTRTHGSLIAPAPGRTALSSGTRVMPIVRTGAGLTITPTYDVSVLSSPQSAAVQNVVNSAIAIYENLFSDPINVSIYVRYSDKGADGTTPLGSGTVAQSEYPTYEESWSAYISALQADSKTQNDAKAVSNLPPAPLSTSIEVSPANGRAVGLQTPPAMDSTGDIGNGAGFIYDAVITLNSSVSFSFGRPPSATLFDAQSSVEHEMDEVLGLGSSINQGPNYRPQDLFTYSSPGVRSISTNGNRYLSIDNGVTDIVGMNQDSGGDYGDWLSANCPQENPFVQNAFGCEGQQADVTATSPEGINLDAIGYDLTGGSPASTSCTPSSTTLCLSNNRFAVSTTWRTSDGNSGNGTAVSLSGDTGYFWFFNSSNVEMVLKVLNGCGVNSHYWVFAGGLTNVAVTMTVIDMQTGSVRTYNNPVNTAFQPIQDTGAFATCP